MSEATQRWTVGAATITSVVEAQTDRIPPELFLPQATAADIVRHAWATPDFADADGGISLRVQAFLLQVGDRTILVDPCVGNGKARALPFWNEQSRPLTAALRHRPPAPSAPGPAAR